jgi:hypothetical protein
VADYVVVRVRRVRKSRSRRVRRRRRRVVLFVLTTLLACSGFWLGSRLPSTSPLSGNQDVIGSAASQGGSGTALPREIEQSADVAPGRLIYPYSVVPGGVSTVAELKAAMLRDRVVARHYAGFDFKKARVIELRRSRLAYLSYRIGERILWTRRQIALHAGEKLLSDGTITARARCGNRLSELPQVVAGPAEPTVETFDTPIIEGSLVAQAAFPGTFESVLLTRSTPLGFEPQNPGAPGLAPVSWGNSPGLFAPPLPGTCLPAKKPKPGVVEANLDSAVPGKKKKPHCSPKPPVVPEPGTMLLVASGIGGIYLRYRKRTTERSANLQIP